MGRPASHRRTHPCGSATSAGRPCRQRALPAAATDVLRRPSASPPSLAPSSRIPAGRSPRAGSEMRQPAPSRATAQGPFASQPPRYRARLLWRGLVAIDRLETVWLADPAVNAVRDVSTRWPRRPAPTNRVVRAIVVTVHIALAKILGRKLSGHWRKRRSRLSSGGSRSTPRGRTPRSGIAPRASTPTKSAAGSSIPTLGHKNWDSVGGHVTPMRVAPSRGHVKAQNRSP